MKFRCCRDTDRAPLSAQRRKEIHLYRFYLNGIKNEYHLEELAREFLANDEFEIIPVDFHEGFSPRLTDKSYLLNGEKDADLDGVKRELYRILSNLTGITPEWGTLTGYGR